MMDIASHCGTLHIFYEVFQKDTSVIRTFCCVPNMLYIFTPEMRTPLHTGLQGVHNRAVHCTPLVTVSPIHAKEMRVTSCPRLPMCNRLSYQQIRGENKTLAGRNGLLKNDTGSTGSIEVC